MSLTFKMGYRKGAKPHPMSLVGEFTNARTTLFMKCFLRCGGLSYSYDRERGIMK